MSDVPDPNTVGGFLEGLTVQMLQILVSLFVFWTGFIKNLVNRKEVEEMIKTQTPYAQDRHLIMERLNDSKEATAILFRALEKNTEVMTELKIQIATLGKTLEALEDRIERG